MTIDPGTLAYWNEVTPHHVTSSAYRTEEFRRGEIVLDPVVRNAVGDVRDARLLHLQCHFGLDTLSLARMGARVTGLDYSSAAIEQARALAAEAGIDAEFVLADVLEPPDHLTGFDVVFASWGSIYWISDFSAWMRVAANALRPGGRLFLCEGHPALLMLDERAPAGELRVRWPYDSDGPLVFEDEIDYAGAKASAHRTTSYMHGFARILTAALEAGLTIQSFAEGHRIPWKALDQMVEIDRHYWGLPPDVPVVPLSFTLEAVKPI